MTHLLLPWNHETPVKPADCEAAKVFADGDRVLILFGQSYGKAVGGTLTPDMAERWAADLVERAADARKHAASTGPGGTP